MLFSHNYVTICQGGGFMQSEKKHSYLSVRISTELHEKLKQRAKEEGRSVSNMVIRILEMDLNKNN